MQFEHSFTAERHWVSSSSLCSSRHPPWTSNFLRATSQTVGSSKDAWQAAPAQSCRNPLMARWTVRSQPCFAVLCKSFSRTRRRWKDKATPFFAAHLLARIKHSFYQCHAQDADYEAGGVVLRNQSHCVWRVLGGTGTNFMQGALRWELIVVWCMQRE